MAEHRQDRRINIYMWMDRLDGKTVERCVLTLGIVLYRDTEAVVWSKRT
jgi:hypothetical protein